MQFKGFIRKAELVPGEGDKKPYLKLSIVENWGKKGDPNQSSMWYNVRAYGLDELTQELLVKDTFVEVTGKLKLYTYKKAGTDEAIPAADVMAIRIDPLPQPGSASA